jgi:hypothetical protein
MMTALSTARDRASADMDFEQAAQIHERVMQVEAAAAARDAVVASIAGFHGLALTKSAVPRVWNLWPMWDALWQPAIPLDFASEAAQAKSMDRQLSESVAAALAAPRTAGNRSEELGIFSRWYFSSWRDGAWFPFRTLDDVPYRKLVREISRRAKQVV